MKFAVTQEQMRQIDDYMIRVMKIPGIVLMENAARTVVDFIGRKYKTGSVAVFCGCGNNGGDGFAVARGLIANGFDVSVILVGDDLTIGGDARVNYEIYESLGKKLFIVRKIEDLMQAEDAARGADIVVDALFGTGISREIEGIQKEVISVINGLGAYKISVDIPSGISGDTGAVMGEAVRADATVTFQYPKIGHMLYPGREYTGELTVAPIGEDIGCPVLKELDVRALDENESELKLPRRHPNTNKGDYGRLLVVAGSVGMAGAAVLCCRAAIRTGVGLTTLASIDTVVNVVQNSVPEVVCKILPGEMESLTRNAAFEVDRLIKNKTAMAVGPGISENQETQEFVNHMLVNHELIKVFDADALNVIAHSKDILLHKAGEVILTPHPREFSHIADVNVEDVLADRIGAVRAFLAKYDVTLVLKGAVTVVANRERGVTLVSAGSPGMAKGGSGDVLTGIISSLAAQGRGAYDSAVLGVLINGMAGKIAAEEKGEYSMTPSDTINNIGKAVAGLISAETGGMQPRLRPYVPNEDLRTEETTEGFVLAETADDLPMDSMGMEEPFKFLSPEDEFMQKNPYIQQKTEAKAAETQPDSVVRRRIVPKPHKK